MVQKRPHTLYLTETWSSTLSYYILILNYKYKVWDIDVRAYFMIHEEIKRERKAVGEGRGRERIVRRCRVVRTSLMSMSEEDNNQEYCIDTCLRWLFCQTLTRYKNFYFAFLSSMRCKETIVYIQAPKLTSYNQFDSMMEQKPKNYSM